MKTRNKSVGSFEAKTHLASLLEDVRKGHEYVITKRGKAVAKLIPYINHEENNTTEDIMEQFKAIRDTVKGKINIKEYINEGRKH